MKENQELNDNEELKKFLLREAIILCPSIKEETSEGEKLQMLYRTQKRMNKLLSLLYHCDFGMHYVEIYHVFGFYFTEKDGEKRKKRKMSERLEDYGQFMYHLVRMKSVIAHYYAYSLQHLRSLEHTMELYYPGYLQNRMKDIPREQKMDILKEETEK